MLFYYFLKKLYSRFFLFLIGATFLFASGDLFARMTALSSGFLFVMFALFMVPLMLLCALPIASSCAVATVVSNLFLEDEILLLRFLPAARTALTAAVLTFACTVFLGALPLLLYWVPQSYWKGKQFLATAAYHHLDCLQSKKWHKISSGFSVRFNDKQKDEQGLLRLKTVIIRYQEKNKTAASLIFAEYGLLCKGALQLEQGTVYSGKPERLGIATFSSMNIDMAQISGFNDFYKPEKHSKFLMSSQLWQQRQTDIISFLELHKRWSQLLWNFLIPFFVFWFMICFSDRKNNLLISISLVSVLFLLFYFSTNVATSCAQAPIVALVLLYGIPLLLVVGFLVRYKREW